MFIRRTEEKRKGVRKWKFSLSQRVRHSYTIGMLKLAQWMEQNGWSDKQVAEAVDLSRVQINRIRRGECAPSTATALRLEAVTGIAWHAFIHVPSRRKRRRNAA